MIEFELFKVAMTVEELKVIYFERLLEALRKGIFMENIGFVQVVRIFYYIVSFV